MKVKKIIKTKFPFAIRIYHAIKNEIDLIKYNFHHKMILAHSQKYQGFALENKIVFLNFDGRGYGCNPKYIAEEIIKRKLKYDLVWLVKKDDTTMPKQIRQVLIDSEECYKELATAKVIINNVKGDINLSKRLGQFYIQTWHAGFSPKYLEGDAKSTLPPCYILESKYNSKDSDLFISNSIAQTEEYRRAFWCNCEILECGLPRNDVFWSDLDNKKRVIKEQLSIKFDCKIVMYAPTFRGGNDQLSDYGIDLDSIKTTIEQKFEGEWIVLLRMHPNIKTAKNTNSNIIDVSNYPDMQDLLIITDILITDYSSSMFDIIEMNKMVFVYANDLESYQQLRGLKQEFFSLPFSIAQTNTQLIDNILGFNEYKYIREIEKVREKYCTYDSGRASEAIVNLIEDRMNDCNA